MSITLKELTQKPDFISLVNAQLQELAAEKPDFIYLPEKDVDGLEEGCSYVTGRDGVGCIFGQAFQRLGVDSAELANIEKERGTKRIAFLLGIVGYDKTPAEWMELQADQDRETTWGECVSENLGAKV